MKKIFFALTLLLAACTPDYNQKPQLQDYTKSPFYELPVNRVVIESARSSKDEGMHVENTMPISVEKFLKNWATVHLHPNYQTENKARFIIRKADMTRKDAPMAGLFVYDNYKYTLTYHVSIIVEHDQGKKTFDVEGFLSQTLPQKATKEQRDNMFMYMLNDLDAELNKQVSAQIKENFLD